MKIVTDSTADISAKQLEGLTVKVIPLHMILDGIDYRSGVDITSDETYVKLASSGNLPVTTPPTLVEFRHFYEWLAEDDPEILSIHLSSGLSETVNVARQAASQVIGADITVVDSGTITAGLGWQVEAAARAAKAGWPLEQILELIGQVRRTSDMMFTVNDLTYLIHGGRINHLLGGIANVFNIKPIIGINPETLIYETRGMKVSFNTALKGVVEAMLRRCPRGSRLRVQMSHVDFPEAIEELAQLVEAQYQVEWLPTIQTDPVLGAHTGPTLAGLIFALLDEYPELPVW